MPNHQKKKTVKTKKFVCLQPEKWQTNFFQNLKKSENVNKKKKYIYIYQLDLVLNSEDGGDLSDFITNGEWYLLG